MEILTERLRLRPWRDEDREPFAAMSLDPGVRSFLWSIQCRADSDAWIDRQMKHEAEHGYCLWAAETRQDGAFAGSIGLLWASYEAHFTPAVELGWRLAPAFWGRGLAPEGAEACLRHGFDGLGRDELVATTAPANANSRRVMAKLGMTHDPVDDFDHPRVPEGNPLRRCVLYRLRREDWRTRRGVAKPA